MKHSFSKIYVGAIALLIGASSCSDQFLKDKKDYNNMTTVDVYSDPQQATAVFATIYKQIISRYNSPLCGADPLMRQDQATGCPLSPILDGGGAAKMPGISMPWSLTWTGWVCHSFGTRCTR